MPQQPYTYSLRTTPNLASPERERHLSHAHSRCKALPLQAGRPPRAPTAAGSARRASLEVTHKQLLRQDALVHALQVLHRQDGLICALLILRVETSNQQPVSLLGYRSGPHLTSSC